MVTSHVQEVVSLVPVPGQLPDRIMVPVQEHEAEHVLLQLAHVIVSDVPSPLQLPDKY